MTHEDNELQIVDSIISYTDSFIKKLRKQRQYIDETIARLEKEKKTKVLYREHKWGVKATDDEPKPAS